MSFVMEDALPPKTPVLPLQKTIDVADWFNPRMVEITKQLGWSDIPINARSWEYCRVFDIAERLNLLKPDAHGVGFGVGRERLLFAMAERCSHILATDIYNDTTAWTTSRTNDPSKFVLAAAPPGFDVSRVKAKSMDARSLDLPDSEFDFGYSISSVEHFGTDDDIIKHFCEVRRILKDTGVYLCTTEVRVGGPTRKTVGNYAFEIEHLLSLIAASGFSAEPTVDFSLTRYLPNAPVEDPQSAGTPSLWRNLGGCVSGPVTLVLRSGKMPEVSFPNREDTTSWLIAKRNQIALKYRQWQILGPFDIFPLNATRKCEPWSDLPSGPGLVFGSAFTYFGAAEIDVYLTAAAKAAKGTLAIAVYRMSTVDGERSNIRPAEPIQLNDRESETRTQSVSSAPPCPLIARRFSFTATSEASYSIRGILSGEQPIQIKSVSIMARSRRIAA